MKKFTLVSILVSAFAAGLVFSPGLASAAENSSVPGCTSAGPYNTLTGQLCSSIPAANPSTLSNNSSSTLAISSITGPSAISAGGGYIGVYTVNASDSAGATLLYSVDWKDGNAVLPIQSSNIFSHAYMQSGRYAPVFTVTDSLGRNATGNFIVDVGSSSVLYGDVNGDGKIDCTDVNMITDAYLGKITLTADQKERADVNVDRNVNNSDALYLVQKYGLTSCAGGTSQPAGLPVISSLAGPSALTVNQIGAWTANASDSSGSRLSYTIDWGDGTAKYSANTASGQSIGFSHIYSTDGSFIITIIVANSAGQAAQKSLNVAVSYPFTGDPVISSIAGPSALAVSQTGTWTVSASDPLNGKLSYYFDWGDGYNAASYDSTFTHSYAKTGTYIIRILANSSSGKSVQKNSSVTVSSIASPPPPNYSIGDVNGDGKIDCADVNMILQAYAGTVTLTADQAKRADVDNNGSITHADASLLNQQYGLSCGTAPQTPAFGLSISGTNSNITANSDIGTATIGVAVSRTGGFTGGISLNFSANGSFNGYFYPSSISSNGVSSTLILGTEQGGVPTGTYTVTITGQSGTLTANASTTITVNPSVPPPPTCATPSVGTSNNVTGITSTSATGSGYITSQAGNCSVSVSGIVWSASQTPAYNAGSGQFAFVSGGQTVNGPASGLYSAGNMTGLSSGTTYYYRMYAYVPSLNTTIYGNTVNFTTAAGTPPPPSIGDVNGDGKIDCSDANMILQAATGTITLTPDQKMRADINGDGQIKADDASLLMQKNNLACGSSASASSFSASALYGFNNASSVSKNQPASPASGGKNSAASCSFSGATLWLGMHSSDVRCLQERLNAKGFTVAGTADGQETDYFGMNTFTALKNFQQSNGLSSDGVLGPKTQTALSYGN